jgi:hypothetical protein
VEGDVARFKRIVLYGSSLVIVSVGASLERVGQFEVIHLPLPARGPSELDALAPDVLVFDVENDHLGPAFSLLETRPGLLLLGINPEGDLVRLWSRRQCRAPSTRHLTALIEGVTSALEECTFLDSATGTEA